MRFVAGRGTDEQVATRGPMGSNSRSTDEVLLTGAPEQRTMGKQLRPKEEPAGKGSNSRQRKHLLTRKHLLARKRTAGKGT